jgi:hypothetical protein
MKDDHVKKTDTMKNPGSSLVIKDNLMIQSYYKLLIKLSLSPLVRVILGMTLTFVYYLLLNPNIVLASSPFPFDTWSSAYTIDNGYESFNNNEYESFNNSDNDGNDGNAHASDNDVIQTVEKPLKEEESTLSDTGIPKKAIPLIDILTAINLEETFSKETKTVIGDLIRLQESINPKNLFLKSGLPGKELTIGMDKLLPAVQSNPDFYKEDAHVGQLHALTRNTHNPIIAHYVVLYNIYAAYSDCYTTGEVPDLTAGKSTFRNQFLKLAYPKA